MKNCYWNLLNSNNTDKQLRTKLSGWPLLIFETAPRGRSPDYKYSSIFFSISSYLIRSFVNTCLKFLLFNIIVVRFNATISRWKKHIER